jgi:hypothetical protein
VRGRCDLYVAHGTTSFAIEAKQAWQSIGKRASKNRITPTMSAARRDAGNLTADQADHRLAVVFITPYIPLSEVAKDARAKRVVDSAKVKSAFAGWLDGMDTSAFDAHAVVFTARCENFVSKYDKVFPGVFMAVKRVQKGTRRTRGTA